MELEAPSEDDSAVEPDTLDSSVDVSRLFTYKHQSGEITTGNVLKIQQTCVALGNLSLNQIELLASAAEAGQKLIEEQDSKEKTEESEETEEIEYKDSEHGASERLKVAENNKLLAKNSDKESGINKALLQQQIFSKLRQPNKPVGDKPIISVAPAVAFDSPISFREVTQVWESDKSEPATATYQKEWRRSAKNDTGRFDNPGFTAKEAKRKARSNENKIPLQIEHDSKKPIAVSAGEAVSEQLAHADSDDGNLIVAKIEDLDFIQPKNNAELSASYNLQDDEEIILPAKGLPPTYLEFLPENNGIINIAPELKLPMDEVEQTILLVAERMAELDDEMSEEVHEILGQIAEKLEENHIISESDPEPLERMQQKEDFEDEIKGLFMQLLDRLEIDHTPELLDCLVVLGLENELPGLADISVEEEIDIKARGTHEIIKQLLFSISNINNLPKRIHQLGKSALRLYKIDLQLSAIC